MKEVLFKIIGAVLILVIVLIFGILPLKIPDFKTNKKLLSISNAFSGGLFIALGIIHILPEASESLE